MKANIVFVDIDKDTLTMDYEDLKRKISPNTKLIVTVNLGGLPTDKRIFYLAEEKKIPVVVDACQSLGISENFGDYIIYSFQAIKHFNTCDGGMLVVKNKDDYERAKKLRWFGIDREKKTKNNWKCLNSQREICMNIEEPGYKFHMNDVSATMGIVGLKHCDELLFNRMKIVSIYNKKFKENNIKTVVGGSYWLYCLIVSNSFEFSEKLRDKGVECDPVHLRNDIFTVFGGKRKLKNMDYIEDKYLYIPIHNAMSEEDANYVAKMVNSVREEIE
jgi:dTDP-4-amino-4,6-dideoxygalactose transaminase